MFLQELSLHNPEMSSDDAAILLSAGLKFVVLLSGAANPRREPPPVLQTSIGPFNPTEQLDRPATQPDTPQPPSSKRADFASSRSRITGGAGGPLSTPISRSDGNIGGDTPGSAAPAAEVMSENASPQISGQGLDVPLFAAEVVCATDVFSSLSQECVTVVLSSLRYV